LRDFTLISQTGKPQSAEDLASVVTECKLNQESYEQLYYPIFFPENITESDKRHTTQLHIIIHDTKNRKFDALNINVS